MPRGRRRKRRGSGGLLPRAGVDVERRGHSRQPVTKVVGSDVASDAGLEQQRGVRGVKVVKSDHRPDLSFEHVAGLDVRRSPGLSHSGLSLAPQLGDLRRVGVEVDNLGAAAVSVPARSTTM
jgi:hypothetical protein